MSGDRNKQLLDLEARLDATATKVSEAISRQLGYGNFHALDQIRRNEVEEETNDAIERWGESELDATTSNRPMQNAGELQHLLQEYHEIEEKILDLRDLGFDDQEDQ